VHQLPDLKPVLGHNESAVLFSLIVAHVAELTRPFDEAALPVCAFLNGCSLVAERVNRLPGQIRGLASASSFGGPRWRGGGKGLFEQPANCLRAGGPGSMIGDPAIKPLHELRLNADADELALSRRGWASFFLCYHGLAAH
jgi:hypothetical protein